MYLSLIHIYWKMGAWKDKLAFFYLENYNLDMRKYII